jgi:dihydroneopterin aldolase
MATKFKKSNPILTGTWVPENLAENDKKTNKTYNIIIKDLLLDALIGIHAHEKKKKQKVLINLLLKASDSFKINDDDITNVVSYEYIVNDIEKLINSGHFGLLETLSEKVAKICLKDERVLNAFIKIEKLEVFKNTKSVGIEIYRENKKNNSLRKIGKILKIKK